MSAEAAWKCIIRHPVLPRILFKKDAQGWRLPASIQPDIWFIANHVTCINTDLNQSTGLQTCVLREKLHPKWNVCTIEVISGTDSLDGHYAWLELTELAENTFEHEEERGYIVENWASLVEPSAEESIPWFRRGWFLETRDWFRSQLTAMGCNPTGETTQLKGGWEWSSILTTPTTAGTIYLKSDCRLPGEPAILEELSKRP